MNLPDTLPDQRPLRVLAVASGGGHWVQLLRLRPALRGHDVVFAYAGEGTPSGLGDAPWRRPSDGHRGTPARLLRALSEVARLVRRERPDVVLTTGAAPGLLAVLAGRLLGARTLFLDSIANAERPSMSARLAARFADRVLTQWEHLARPEGPGFGGAVL